ncbi:MAG: DUF3298 and DUF4163 domain-containing protein [Clostridiaceae bacterium]|nr:DUF3298 and DUF4163 domain-containing protein [Clostridiaceae bacterium]
MKCDFIKTQTIKDKLYYNRTQMVEVQIDYPFILSSHYPNSMTFNTFYRQKARNQYRYASSKLYREAVKHYNSSKEQGFPFHSYVYNGVFEVTYCKKPFISLYSDVYEFTGGAHGMTTRSSDTWDLKNNRIMELCSLFKKGFNYKYFMLEFIEAEAKRRKITGKADYFDNLKANIVKHFDEKNYYLTEKGIAIFYPLYTIAPYSTGIQVFVIPYPLFGSNLVYKF